MSHLNYITAKALESGDVNKFIESLCAGGYSRFYRSATFMDQLASLVSKASEKDGQRIVELLIQDDVEWSAIEEVCFESGLSLTEPTLRYMATNVRNSRGNTDALVSSRPTIGEVISGAYSGDLDRLVEVLNKFRPFILDKDKYIGQSIITYVLDYGLESGLDENEFDKVTDIILKFLDNTGNIRECVDPHGLDYLQVRLEEERSGVSWRAKGIIRRFGDICGESRVIEKCLGTKSDVVNMAILSLYDERTIKKVADSIDLSGKLSIYLELGDADAHTQSI